MTSKWLRSLLVVASLVAAASMPAFAKTAQQMRDEKSAEIPVCSKKLGTISVVEPETDWWREAGLGSPEALIKVFVQAYTDLVHQLGGLTDNPSAASAPQAVTMTRPGRMYATPDTKGQVVKSLDPGTMLYPTGEQRDVLWEVTDELGAKGWVSSLLFEFAR